MIILDACRADYLRQLKREAGTARSLARDTHNWVLAFAELYPQISPSGCLWFTANPVVDRALPATGAAEQFPTVRVWQTSWQEVGVNRIPTVHPQSVNEAVRRYVNEYGQPERTIIHYIQPHSPYIGSFELPLAGWGDGPEDMSKALQRLTDPRKAVREGQVSWSDVRRAYRANVELVLRHAEDLASDLKGTVVITADHGEILGEGERFGHDPTYHDMELRLVPWMVIERGSFSPAAIVRARLEEPDEGVVKRRLEALGYK
ncbi:MAG: hypothetical protein R6X33_11470 [Candidatus Brocadiia bacterium]